MLLNPAGEPICRAEQTSVAALGLSARRVVRTGVLEPGESFELELDLPEGQVPIKFELSCARTVVVPELEDGFGRRRAGFVLEERELVV